MRASTCSRESQQHAGSCAACGQLQHATCFVRLRHSAPSEGTHTDACCNAVSSNVVMHSPCMNVVEGSSLEGPLIHNTGSGQSVLSGVLPGAGTCGGRPACALRPGCAVARHACAWPCSQTVWFMGRCKVPWGRGGTGPSRSLGGARAPTVSVRQLGV